MIQADACFTNCINSPVRHVRGRVELYNGSTLLNTFKHTDLLKSFKIERVGESKFFGFGVMQKINVKLLDTKRELNITTENTLEAVFGTGCDFVYTFPLFYISEVHRDENTNELSITAYDALYNADKHTVNELELQAPYTISDFAKACARFLGVPMSLDVLPTPFSTYYEAGANFEGSETIREALNAIAEATQTIYYINSNWELTFKRLDITGEPVLNINKDRYFSLQSSTNRRLTSIVSATELGDNVIASLEQSGSTQYVRDNPFWELREDIAQLVDNALLTIGGLTINQFECNWRGNYLLEIGDKISLTTKDNDVVISYILDDSIEYNGGMSANTKWSYLDNESETLDNPTTLGEALKKTYAKVDKTNKEIELVAGEAAAIKMTTENITTSVKKIDDDMSDLATEVTTKVSAEQVDFYIQTALTDGIESVTTTTGFTFNEEGLHISKTDSEIATSITEDGMTVYKNDKSVLIADNQGVKAEDLHATTYLIVGTNSRFENYGSNRTGCFWIGN